MTATGDQRIDGFDWLRLLAAFAVVWIHGADTNATARHMRLFCAFAVPCFAMVAFYLSAAGVERHRERGYGYLIRSRARRLLLVYLAWSGLYLALRFAKHAVFSDTPLKVDVARAVVCGGASYQLWFVPALLLWIILFGPMLVGIARMRRSGTMGIALVCLGVVLLWLGRLVLSGGMVTTRCYMLPFAVQHSGFAPMGMGFWMLFGSGRPAAIWRTIVAPVAGALLIFAAFAWRGDGFTALFATGVMLLALWTRIPAAPRPVAAAARYAFGIYLAHAVFVEGLQVVASRWGVSLGSFQATAGVIVVSFASGLLLCVVLGRFKLTRWLVL